MSSNKIRFAPGDLDVLEEDKSIAIDGDSNKSRNQEPCPDPILKAQTDRSALAALINLYGSSTSSVKMHHSQGLSASLSRRNTNLGPTSTDETQNEIPSSEDSHKISEKHGQATESDLMSKQLATKKKKTRIPSLWRSNNHLGKEITSQAERDLRQSFIIKYARSLLAIGAPSHRVEHQLIVCTEAMGLKADFLQVPGLIMISFKIDEDSIGNLNFVKGQSALDLGKLNKLHVISQKVLNAAISIPDGITELQELIDQPTEYSKFSRLLMTALSSFLLALSTFQGSILDAAVSFALGAILAFLQLYVASISELFANVFEITAAIIVAFIARAISTSFPYFCFEAMVSSGIAHILPGYIIMIGALELSSKKVISGAVRMLYALCFSLFLGFSLTIGSDLWFLISNNPSHHIHNTDSSYKAALRQFSGNLNGSDVNLDGSLSEHMIALANITFSFYDESVHTLATGKVSCPRAADLPWWQSDIRNIYYLSLFVPFICLLNTLKYAHPWKSRQVPVMVAIATVGWVANRVAKQYIGDRSDVVAAVGAFAIGFIGNVYARLTGNTVVGSIMVGIGFLIPSGIAAAGGLSMANQAGHQSAQSYHSGLAIALKMVQVSIGITIGLFSTVLLVHGIFAKFVKKNWQAYTL